MYIITEKASNIIVFVTNKIELFKEDVNYFKDVDNDIVFSFNEYNYFELDYIPPNITPYEYKYIENEFVRAMSALDIIEMRQAMKNAATINMARINNLSDTVENIVNPIIDVDNMSLEEYKQYRQTQNKEALASFLKNNPLLWTDGKYYGVTEEDQNEMLTDKSAYEFKQSIGQTNWKLEWHSVKSACREFSINEFAALLNAIVDFVYPYRQLEMSYKESIYNANTKEDVKAIKLIYKLEEQVGEIIESSDSET